MGTGIDLRTVWLTTRLRLRVHWRSLVALTLLVGLVGAIVLASAAAARRAGSSFDRLLDAAAAPNIDVELELEGEGEVDPAIVDELAAIDGVEGASLVAFVALIPAGQGLPFLDGITFADLATAGTGAVDGLIVRGRSLDPTAAEVLLNPAMAEATGLDVGDRITLDGLSEEQAFAALEGDRDVEMFSVEARVVGITRGAEDVADASDPYTLASAALATSSGAAVFPGLIGVHAEDDALARVLLAVEQQLPDSVVRPAGDLRSRIIDGISVQATGLAAFAAVVGAVGLFAAWQSVSRLVALARQDDDVLGALGVTALERQASAALLVLPSALGGAALALVAGLVAAPHAITGLAAQAEPDRGIWFDPLVATGVVVTGVAVVVGAALGARTPRDRVGRFAAVSAVERALLAVHLPIFERVGARRALSRAARRWAGRAAALAAVVAIAGITAVLIVDHSIGRLFHSPQAWGAEFDVFIAPGPNGSGNVEAVAARFADDDAVEAASVVAESSVTLRRADGVPIFAPVIHARPAKGLLEPWVVVDGTTLRGNGDALVGRGLLDDLDLDVGDELELTTETGRHRLVIAGSMVAYGTERVDRQIAVTAEAAEAIGAETEDPGIVARLVPGADVNREVARLQEELLQVETPAPPAAVDNLDELGSLPVALAVTVGVLGLLAVGHSLTTSVQRSRREVGALRAFGATASQLRRTVCAQALTVALVGVGLGLPLGIALGRVAFVNVADGVGVVARVGTPGVALAILTVAAFAAIGLTAVPPLLQIVRRVPAREIDGR